MKVPVVDSQQNPLMPTNPWKAERLIKSGRATPFWKMGIFCIRLNYETDKNVQPVVIGIDPGSKREAFTVKSCSYTYINIQTNAINYVKSKVETRAASRRSRRFRKTPYRKCRYNRKVRKGWIPPSVKARWDFKINIVKKLQKIYPITDIIIEDIKAKKKKGQRNWNENFSPLETGKKYGYAELEKLAKLILISGIQTARLREKYQLIKIKNKLYDKFEAHCVDSWAIANSIYEGKLRNRQILKIAPIQLHRRQLHVFVPIKGNIRKKYGGTQSLGVKRGSIIRHKRHGICYAGGSSSDQISLHSLDSGKRITQRGRIKDIKFISYNRYIINNVTR